MVDTVNAYYVPTAFEIIEIEERLNETPRYKKGYITRYHGNISFRYHYLQGTLASISMYGSFPKVVYATNYRPTDLFTIKQAVMGLMRKSKLPIQDFIVHRLDLGFNIEMDHPVESYIAIINSLQVHKVREFSKHSITFQNKSNKLAFYDKVKQTEKLRNELLDDILKDPKNQKLREQLKYLKADLKAIQNKNLLRVEYRIFKNLPVVFNKKRSDSYKKIVNRIPDEKFTIRDLHKEWFYVEYRDKLYNVFKKLKYKSDLHYKNITNPSDFRDYLVLQGLESIGWHEKTQLALNLTRLIGDMTSSQKSAVNRYIKMATDNKVVVIENDIINELKLKVAKAALIQSKNFLNEFD